MKVFLLFLVLFTVTSAKLQDSGAVHPNNANVVDDAKVEELLLKEKNKADEGYDLKAFISEYLSKFQLLVTVDEALNIHQKVKDADKTSVEFKAKFGQVLDVAHKLKSRMSKCKATRGKSIASFVADGMLKDIQLRFNSMSKDWECPSKGEVRFAITNYY